MRNEYGPVAHGKDAFLDAISADHARAFLHTGDAILGILLNALEGKEPDLTVTREPYERFLAFNERIDRAVGVEARVDEDGDWPVVVISIASGPKEEAIELRVEPSRLLYGVDRSAYVEVLRTTRAIAPELDDGGQIPLLDQAAAATTAAQPAPVVDIVPKYAGRLAPILPGLRDFLAGEGVKLSETQVDGADLAESLLTTIDQNLGVDWAKRETLQARLKVACRRVLTRFGLSSDQAEGVVERLLAWVRRQVPAGDEAVPGAAEP